jgi:predicted enzyme related to lactoylglutathione lyase
MPKNVIQHVEWATRDPKRLQSFYGRIFDWKFNEAMPGYTMIDGVGGIAALSPEQQMPTGVTNYVNVDDLSAKEDLIRKGGGQIYKSKQEVPGMGWFTIFADPDGNTVALWQAAKRPARAAASKKKTTSAKRAKSAKKARSKTSRRASR